MFLRDKKGEGKREGGGEEEREGEGREEERGEGGERGGRWRQGMRGKSEIW